MLLLSRERIEEIHQTLLMGGYNVTSPFNSWGDNMAIYTGKKLRIRLRNYEPQGFRIDIAEKATFDRWANSRNFEITVNPKRLLFALWNARRIINAGTYDFNSYFETINLDEFAQ